MADSLSDLNTVEDIERFVTRFYNDLLKDPQLSPIFLEVAGIDLSVHKPLIIRYWEKLLLGGRAYQRHTMNIHRAVHSKHTLSPHDFECWFAHFERNIDLLFQGPTATRAKRLASTIADNMQRSLNSA